MNRRELGLVLAIATSFIATGGVAAVAQSGNASSLTATAPVADTPASGAMPRSKEATSGAAASLTASAEITSGAAPSNCLTTSSAALPSVSNALTSGSPEQPLEAVSSLTTSGGC